LRRRGVIPLQKILGKFRPKMLGMSRLPACAPLDLPPTP
jgi:hypothetical protein